MSAQNMPEYDDALHIMEAYGGSFIKSLAACYYAADWTNKQRLRAAFSDYFEAYERKYREHCELRAKATQQSSEGSAP